MNIDRFKATHVDILAGIAHLRKLTQEGVEDRAVDIAHELEQLSKTVIHHLAVEDKILYPQVEGAGDMRMTQMSQHYQHDMKGIASAFINFARHWGNATALTRAPADFKAEANTVLRAVFERMIRENREFYPAIEAL